MYTENTPEKLQAVQNIRCFVLDMDGTFYLGEQLLPGSMDFIQKVNESGRRYLFMTNNSSKNAPCYVQKLHRMGLDEAGDGHIYTSGQATGQYLDAHFPGKRIFLLGNTFLAQELADFGVTIDNADPEVVVVGFDTTLDFDKMTRVCDFVRAGLPYIATHPDFNCPVENGFIPDCGAIQAFIEASTGRKPDAVVGKPNRPVVDGLLERTGLGKDQIAIVGDRLYTDVRTGVDHGLLGILVLSGETQREDIPASPTQPDLVFGRLCNIIPYL